MVYQATVNVVANPNQPGEPEYREDLNYVGLAQDFKPRYRDHKSSFKHRSKSKKTTLAGHYWKCKDEGLEPKVSWKVLENAPIFNPITGICLLCLREKFQIIMNPHLAKLNSRCEIFSACRHKYSKLIIPIDEESESVDQN